MVNGHKAYSEDSLESETILDWTHRKFSKLAIFCSTCTSIQKCVFASNENIQCFFLVSKKGF